MGNTSGDSGSGATHYKASISQQYEPMQTVQLKCKNCETNVNSEQELRAHMKSAHE